MELAGQQNNTTGGNPSLDCAECLYILYTYIYIHTHTQHCVVCVCCILYIVDGKKSELVVSIHETVKTKAK